MGQTSSQSSGGGGGGGSKHFRGSDFKSSTTSHSTPGPTASQYQQYGQHQTHHMTHGSTGVGGGSSGHTGSSMDYCGIPDELLEQDEGISCLQPRSSYSPTDASMTFRFPGGSGPTNQPNAAVRKIPCVFKYNGKLAKECQLIGSFTSWKEKINMVKSDGDYCVIVDLPEGEHQYKFVVDGRWEHDPNQPTVDDSFSGKNNIVTVKKSDFEVMDALDTDSTHTNNQPFSQKNNDDLSKSPPGEYTDEIPTRGLSSPLSLDKPPYLPPQLLNIVLNKDTSAKCEPTLLPEPNHVMLKHLYALSIRDGVMVLSSTFRFKQKFVTTCFYKPI